MRPPALLLWGLLVHKVFAAGILVATDSPGASPLHVALALVAGLTPDIVLVLVLGALTAVLRRPRAARVLAAAAWILALYAVLNTLLVAAVGAPLTVPMLAYAGDARTAAAGTAPLGITAAALALFALGAAWVVPRLARVRPQRGALMLGGALCASGAVAALDHADVLAPLGLFRSPPWTLARSALPTQRAPAERIRWDAPTGPPQREVLVDARAPTPRHVVLWLAESTGARHVSLTGAAPERTPALERLRGSALVFDDATTPSPVSAKAIFSVLCGLYPLPEPAFEARRFPRIACPSLPEVLAPHGFVAALFHGGYFAFTDKRALLEERGFDLLLDGENLPGRERWWTNGWGIDDAALVDAQLGWLDRVRAHDAGQRTLSVFIPLLPHHEYFLPPGTPTPFGTATLSDRHANGVAYDDALFGRLVEAYRARGLFDDTLFVFVGDHGEAFDEHPTNKIHGSFLYDENVRTPLVFIAPRLFPSARRSARPASHPDIIPTILDLLDVPIPSALQGRSLVAEEFVPRALPIMTFYPNTLVGLVDGPLKYVRAARDGREELYDRARDPGERTNVAALFPDVTASLRARTLDFVDRQRELLAAMPERGRAPLDRFIDEARVLVQLSDGSTRPCTTRGARFECGAGAWVGLAVERSFNMERRCLVVHTASDGAVVLEGALSPPPRTVGVGLTDASRRAGGAPLHARFEVEGVDPVELAVNDRFESSSRMTTLQAQERDRASVRVVVTSVGSRRAACLTLAP